MSAEQLIRENEALKNALATKERQIALITEAVNSVDWRNSKEILLRTIAEVRAYAKM